MSSMPWTRALALLFLVLLFAASAVAPATGMLISASPTQVRQGGEVVVTMAGIDTGSTVVVTLSASGRSPQNPYLNISKLHMPFELANGETIVQGNGTSRIYGEISRSGETWSRSSLNAVGRVTLLSGSIEGGTYEVLQARGTAAGTDESTSVAVTIQGVKNGDPNGPLSFVIDGSSSGSIGLSVAVDGTRVLGEELTIIPSLPAPPPNPDTTAVPTATPSFTLSAEPGFYPLSIPGLSFYPTGSGTTVVLDRLTARGAGYQISVEPSRIEISGKNVQLNVSARDITETARTIRGELINIHLTGVVEPPNMSFGRTSVTFSTDLPHAPSNVDAGVTVSIIEGIPNQAFAAYQQAAAKEGLAMRAAGVSVQCSLRGVAETGRSELRMTVPATWVESNGGIGAVRIGKLSSDGTTAEILPTIYVSDDDGDSLVVEAVTEDGLGTFGLFAVSSASTMIVSQVPTTDEPPIVEAERVANQTITWAGSNVPMVIALAALFVIILMLWWTQKRR